MHIYILIYTNIHIHVITINVKRGHEIEEKRICVGGFRGRKEKENMLELNDNLKY